jgi:hypothetical protein
MMNFYGATRGGPKRFLPQTRNLLSQKRQYWLPGDGHEGKPFKTNRSTRLKGRHPCSSCGAAEPHRPVEFELIDLSIAPHRDGFHGDSTFERKIAVASRPRLRPNSMASRNGSQALADGIRLGFSTSRPVDSTPNPAVTTLAGFEVAFAFPFEERFSGLGLGLGLTVLGGSAASDPVVTSPSLAGFAGGRRPHAPGGRTAIPAAFT